MITKIPDIRNTPPPVTTRLNIAPPRLKDDPPRKLVSPLSFEFKEFPRLVFAVSSLKFSLPRQSYASGIVDHSLKFHFPVMIFLIPAENVCFHNFPAVSARSGGVVTGGGGGLFRKATAPWYISKDIVQYLI